MCLLAIMPTGRERRKTRSQLMYEAKITDLAQFKKELNKLRETHIIVFENDGYYIPKSKEEYLNFIKGLNGQLCNTVKTIEIAYKEMEELECMKHT